MVVGSDVVGAGILPLFRVKVFSFVSFSGLYVLRLLGEAYLRVVSLDILRFDILLEVGFEIYLPFRPAGRLLQFFDRLSRSNV